MQLEPPTASKRIPLLRVRPGHDYRLELLSGAFLRLATHFAWRTCLCTEDEECKLCEFLPVRPYWYLPGKLEPDGRVVLLELTGSTASRLEMGCGYERERVRPGIRIRIWRRTAKASVGVEFLEACEARPELAFDVWGSAVMRVYGMPALRPGEELEQYGRRVRKMIHGRAELVSASLAKGTRKGA